MAKPVPVSDRPAIIKKVKEALASGVNLREACKQAGISHQTYRNWIPKKAARKATKKVVKRSKAPSPSLLNIPIPEPTTPLVILIGAPSDLNAALDRLATIHGAAQ